MEYLEVIITDGTRNRIERIKQLRKESVGMIVSDQDVITAAIACYWQAAEIGREDNLVHICSALRRIDEEFKE